MIIRTPSYRWGNQGTERLSNLSKAGIEKHQSWGSKPGLTPGSTLYLYSMLPLILKASFVPGIVCFTLDYNVNLPRSGASEPCWEFCPRMCGRYSLKEIYIEICFGGSLGWGENEGERLRDFEGLFYKIQLCFPSTSMDWAKIQHLYWYSKALIRLTSGIMALGSFHRLIKEFLHPCDPALLPFTSWQSGLTSKSHICFSVFLIGRQFHPVFFETATAASKNACWAPSCQNCSVTHRDMMMRLQESSLGRFMGLRVPSLHPPPPCQPSNPSNHLLDKFAELNSNVPWRFQN